MGRIAIRRISDDRAHHDAEQTYNADHGVFGREILFGEVFGQVRRS
jgi:hypothetical protein